MNKPTGFWSIPPEEEAAEVPGAGDVPRCTAGRLDADSEELLILTGGNRLRQRLTDPRGH